MSAGSIKPKHQTVNNGIAQFTVPTPTGGTVTYSAVVKDGYTTTLNSTITASQDILNSLTRQTTGFRGYMSLLSQESATTAVILSLWQDEEMLNASEKGAFVELTREHAALP